MKPVATGMVLVAAVAAAGTMFVARAAPEREAVTRVVKQVPAGTFASICKSGTLEDARPDPAWVGTSFEQDNCRAPRMPAAIDGFTASREKVVASMEAVKRYEAASDLFERCIQDFVGARKTLAAKSGQAVSTPLVIIENHRIAASQRNRKLVAARVRTTINNFNEYGSDCPG